MTIEVREILIKAAVTRHLKEHTAPADEARSHETFKAEILEACRRMVSEALREERER